MEPIIVHPVAAANGNFQDITDVLVMEWFEYKKVKFVRKSTSGVPLLLQLSRGQTWHHGDLLFAGKRLMAKIQFKNSPVISFSAKDWKTATDFCYFIGNRHLPVFCTCADLCFQVPYDGNLYDALLVKFNGRIQLTEGLLQQNNMLHLRLYTK